MKLFLSPKWQIHPSYKKNLEFQRLEFFGDKLVSFEISKLLLLDNKLTEGQLSIILSSLVCRETMAKIGKFLIPNMKYTGVLTTNMIASTLEAWIGYRFFLGHEIPIIIEELWSPYMQEQFQSNVKNVVQEYAQKNYLRFFYSYEYIPSEKLFLCKLTMDGLEFTCEGVSKKKASEKCAKKICEFLRLI